MSERAPEAIRSHLRDVQNADGGWGAYEGSPSATEPTAWATLALSHDVSGAAEREVGAGRAWLRELQRPDGSWPHSPAVPESRWATAPAAIALSRSPPDRAAVAPAGRWLLSHRGRGLPWRLRIRYWVFPEQAPSEMDADLVGWAWYPGTFSWVEPTAYALLALKLARADLPTARARHAIDEGERLLLDRVCRDGGWNYGNSVVLGEELWPYPDTTALALIALQDAGDRLAVEEGLEKLVELAERNESGLATALAILCLRLHGRDAGGLAERLAAAYERRGFLGETRTLAMAALALAEGVPPLGLSGAPSPAAHR